MFNEVKIVTTLMETTNMHFDGNNKYEQYDLLEH